MRSKGSVIVDKYQSLVRSMISSGSHPIRLRLRDPGGVVYRPGRRLNQPRALSLVRAR